MLLEVLEREQVQHMTINGVSKEVKTKYCDVVCPNCKAIINQSQSSHLDLIKALSIEQNQTLKYCPMCSIKLDYPCIIDVKVD